MGKSFDEVLQDAISNDKLVIVAVTSNTQARHESDDTPYGAGKTTLALKLSFRYHHYDVEQRRFYGEGLDMADIRNWKGVFEDLFYYPYKILRSLNAVGKGEKQPMAMAVWDDTQYTAGRQIGTPVVVSNLISRLTTSRPEVKVLVLTTPNINDLSSALRSIVGYEMIVFARGEFEVQKIKHYKNFKNPSKDHTRLEYMEGQDNRELGLPAAFTPLAQPVMDYYNTWRAKEKQLRDERQIKKQEDHDLMREPEPVVAGDKSEAGRSLVAARWGKPRNQT